MAYRSPKMENISRDSAGINMSPVGILIEMLEKGHEQHVREASTWASGMETLEKYIGEASSGGSLNELDSLIDDWLEKGEDFSDLTGEETYALTSGRVKNLFNNKKNLVNNFEDSLRISGQHRLNPNAKFDVDKFFYRKGDEKFVEGQSTMKDTEDFYKAFQEWDRQLAGAQIIWDVTSDIGYENLEVFVNWWMNMSANPSITHDLKKRYSPLNILNQGFNSAQATMNNLKNMGITFDSQGNIATDYKTINLKQEYDIEYIDENGNPAVTTKTLRELATDAWDTYRDYNNLSQALTEQTVSPVSHEFINNPRLDY